MKQINLPKISLKHLIIDVLDLLELQNIPYAFSPLYKQYYIQTKLFSLFSYQTIFILTLRFFLFIFRFA